MPIKGNAFLILWHDVQPAMEPEYHRWHTREHMPERLSIPGFRRGRRGVNRHLDRHRYLTLYEGTDLAVFGSPAYLARLNDPTPWSTRVQPAFRNFVRSACEVVASRGEGVGGAIATIRIGFEHLDERELTAIAGELADQVLALEGVSSCHVGIARPEISGAKTTETKLRGTTQDGLFDAVVVVDGIGREAIEAVRTHIVEILNAKGVSVHPSEVAVYDMAYALDSLL